MNPYESGTALARRTIHSNATLAILATEIGERATVLQMLAGFKPATANVVHMAVHIADRNLLIRQHAKQAERRFAVEPGLPSAFGSFL